MVSPYIRLFQNPVFRQAHDFERQALLVKQPWIYMGKRSGLILERNRLAPGRFQKMSSETGSYNYF
jgi:hypothetical protein